MVSPFEVLSSVHEGSVHGGPSSSRCFLCLDPSSSALVEDTLPTPPSSQVSVEVVLPQVGVSASVQAPMSEPPVVSLISAPFRFPPFVRVVPVILVFNLVVNLLS